MTRLRCALAAFLIGFAVFRPFASTAQQYDPRPDILRRKIQMMGAGFVGYVKSAAADTVTVTSDGSYSVIPKGEERTFQITPNTTVSRMKEDGQFEQPQALQPNELRAGEFVGVVQDSQFYTLPASIAERPPTGLAAAPTAPPPAPQDLSPAMQELYRQGYADWRRREQISGSQFVGFVQSATTDTVTVISDRDSSIFLRKGSQYTFQITSDTKVESDVSSSRKEPHGGDQVTIRYRDLGDTHLALGIHIRGTGVVVEAPGLPSQPSVPPSPPSTYSQASMSGQASVPSDEDLQAGTELMRTNHCKAAIGYFDRFDPKSSGPAIQCLRLSRSVSQTDER